MGMDLDIRRIGAADAALLVALRREALENNPLAFGASTEDDYSLSLERVRAFLADPQEQAVFGQFEGGVLAGMVGVRRESRLKRRHKAHIWGMYVAPRARGKGAGRALLAAAIAQARAWPGVEQLQLSVTDAADTARRMYEAAGFRAWGHEPRALHWEGCFVDELHLVLELGVPSGVPPNQGAQRVN
jgi:ribosomal protein S18 acetylase RimI-like enzyme